MKIHLLAFCLFTFCAINGDKIAPSVAKLNFITDELDKKSFGYKEWMGDENQGCISIATIKDLLFLSDIFHNNIKLIKDGDIIATSDCINAKSNWPGRLFVFNNRIVLLTYYNGIHIYSKDLILEKQIKCINGLKELYKVNNESIMFFSETEQITPERIRTNIIKIDCHNNYNIVDTIIESERYMNTISSKYNSKGQLFNIEGNIIKTIDFGTFQLPEEYAPIEEYDAYNLDFSSDKIVFFRSYPDSLNIFIINDVRWNQ
jgi:hypothetical protein